MTEPEVSQELFNTEEIVCAQNQVIGSEIERLESEIIGNLENQNNENPADENPGDTEEPEDEQMEATEDNEEEGKQMSDQLCNLKNK